MDTVDAIRELGRISLGETGLDGVLARVADLAGRAVPGAHEVSVTLLRDRGSRTAASTGPAASAIDEWQHTHGRGPCLDAAVNHRTVYVDDVAAERRWPGWAERAGSVGVCSALSVGLPIRQAVRGALNVFGSTVRAFDEEAVELAGTFAGYAAVGLANADLYDTTAGLVRQMEAAMASRAVIEQAKGIIMGQRRCGPDEAFAILTRVSQDGNRKLRDVAADLVRRAHRHP